MRISFQSTCLRRWERPWCLLCQVLKSKELCFGLFEWYGQGIPRKYTMQNLEFLSVRGRLTDQAIVIGIQNSLDELGAAHGAAQGERATVCGWCSDWILCTPTWCQICSQTPRQLNWVTQRIDLSSDRCYPPLINGQHYFRGLDELQYGFGPTEGPPRCPKCACLKIAQPRSHCRGNGYVQVQERVTFFANVGRVALIFEQTEL